MEIRYDESMTQLLDRSSIIEDAVYAISGLSSGGRVYGARGNSKCGSKCSSHSSRGSVVSQGLPDRVEHKLE